jgi:ribosomal protein L40E
MSNVTCRLCNADNPTGSKYCNHCGALLPPSTNLICPACKAVNPRSLLYCDKCGTRLVREVLPSEPEAKSEDPAAPTAQRAFSLPARPPGETGELDLNHISNWLPTDEKKDAVAIEANQAAALENQAGAVLDDWLDELNSLADAERAFDPHIFAGEQPAAVVSDNAVRPDISDNDAGDFPDWLSEAAVAEPEATESLDDFPDWLSEAAVAEPEATESLDDFPDWLSEAAVAEPEATESLDDFPDWLSEAAVAEPEATESLDDFPDWLNEAAAAEPEVVESLDDFPDWLSEAAVAEPEVTESADEFGDWLREAAAAAEADTEDDDFTHLVSDFLKSSAKGQKEESPAWLQEPLADETETAVQLFQNWPAESGDERDDTPAEIAELPDWLSGEEAGLAGEEFADTTIDELAALFAADDTGTHEQEPATELPPTPDDLSDWLVEMAPRGTGLLSPLDADDSAELPLTGNLEWLFEEDPPQTLDEAAIEVEQETVINDEDRVADEYLPQVEDLELEDESPGDADWLTFLEQGFDETTTGTEEDEADLVASWFGDADAGAWPELPELDPNLLPDEAAETPAEFSQIRDNLPVELAATELPDWLRDSLAPAESQDALGDLQAISPDDLPDWLQPGAEDANMAPPVPAGPLMESARPAPTEWDDVLGEMPHADALPPGIELPPASEFAGPAAPALIVSDAELPAWLQALKPRVVEAMPDVVEKPVQATGPLAGLRNVIEISPVVAEPYAAVRPADFSISRDQELQVELLRQLTRDDEKEATVVAPVQAGALPVWLRLVLTFLLLAALLAGHLLPVAGVALPETIFPPLPVPARDAADLVNRNGGRPVLFAFEYTPAMAGELDLQAAMFLRQLGAAGGPIIVASQYTAGVPVARQATAALPGLSVHEIGFLPGEAIGLRRLGSCLNSGAECSTLYGQPLSPELRHLLPDVGLVIVVTADRTALVNWMEQVAAQSDVPVIAAVSQSLAPVAAAYYAGGQLQGMIAGLPAAAAYERFFPTGERAASEQLAAQTVAQWLVVFLLLVGNVWYALSAAIRRRRPSSIEL